MDFEDSIREAAKRVDRAVSRSMRRLRYDVIDEDDLTGILAGNIEAELDGIIGELTWSTHIMRHRRGRAAEEKQFGADILVHVSFVTSTLTYSKGVLVQAKHKENYDPLNRTERRQLLAQCRKMLSYTPAAFVFDYAATGMRCGSALGVVGSTNPYLDQQCPWTSYRFFLELFRCPIGDERISAANVQGLSKLREDALPMPTIIELSATNGTDSTAA